MENKGGAEMVRSFKKLVNNFTEIGFKPNHLVLENELSKALLK